MFEPAGTEFHFDGRIGERLRANQESWFEAAPARHPQMIGVLRDRKTGPPPPRGLLAWVGEYPGKYLLGAVLSLRISGDSSLRDVIALSMANCYFAKPDGMQHCYIPFL